MNKYRVVMKNNDSYIIETDYNTNDFITKLLGERTNSLLVSTWNITKNKIESPNVVILISNQISHIEKF